MNKVILWTLSITLVMVVFFVLRPFRTIRNLSKNSPSINTNIPKTVNDENKKWLFVPTVDKQDKIDSSAIDIFSWIGYTYKNKIYFRASERIGHSELPKNIITEKEYKELWDQTILHDGDTIWVCLPGGKFLKAVVDTLFYREDVLSYHEYYLMFAARSAPDITNDQSLTILIYNMPPYRSAYTILPESSVSKTDSLMLDEMVGEVYPHMRKTWIELFRANIDEESKKQYPHDYNITFTDYSKLYQFVNNYTSDSFKMVDMRWGKNSSIPNDFGAIQLGKYVNNGYTKLWSNEWYSKPEKESHHISIKNLYYDYLGNLTLILVHQGWEWSRNEVLQFDPETNTFIPDSTYIDNLGL
ncbi:MAG: hypothetical protein Q7U71_07885 [bacterium]|nr:hypothetical protein [bacterium]